MDFSLGGPVIWHRYHKENVSIVHKLCSAGKDHMMSIYQNQNYLHCVLWYLFLIDQCTWPVVIWPEIFYLQPLKKFWHVQYAQGPPSLLPLTDKSRCLTHYCKSLEIIIYCARRLTHYCKIMEIIIYCATCLTNYCKIMEIIYVLISIHISNHFIFNSI